jgi:hypothetical protein
MSARFPGDEPARRPVTWQQKLEQAQTEAQVVVAAREFLAQFSPYEIEALPGHCQPPLKLVDADDLAAYALDLVRHDRQNLGADPLVGKLAAFFSSAASRISQIERRRWPPPPRGWSAESNYSR